MDFIVPILIYSAAFLALFAVAEVLHHRARVNAEYTRKLVHAGTGVLTLGFPIFFYCHWQVIIICGCFLVLLIASRKLNMLQSINNVNRSTLGSVLYPVIVVIVFLFYQYMEDSSEQNLIYYYAPILIMAICDPLAALTGNWYKSSHPGKEGKTWAGTAAFFITALILSATLMFTLQPQSPAGILVWAAVTAFLTALAEKFSNKGWDNFTIPLAAMAVLYLIHEWQ